MKNCTIWFLFNWGGSNYATKAFSSLLKVNFIKIYNMQKYTMHYNVFETENGNCDGCKESRETETGRYSVWTSNISVEKYRKLEGRNTVRSFGQIQLTMFEKYSKSRRDQDFS